MGYHYSHSWILLVLVLCFQTSRSWNMFQSSKKEYSNDNPSDYDGGVAEFSIGGIENHKAIQLVESAKQKLVSSNSCTQNAYRQVFGGCSKVLASDELRSRLAWHLSDCFQTESGQPSFPYCDTKSSMRKCRSMLDNDERKVFLEFLLNTNYICYQLQATAFNRETERLVNDLKKSAEFAEEKLEKMDEKSENLVQSAIQLQDSLSSIDVRTKHLAQASKIVESNVDSVLQHSKIVYEQSKGIAASQTVLQKGQIKMREKMEEEMTTLQDSYTEVSNGINGIMNEAAEIEKRIVTVKEVMSSKMETLQDKTDDIGNLAGISLDKQRQLLDGQSAALNGLQFLKKIQSDALEESRSIVQQLAEFGHKQQEELLGRQEQLQQVHDHLVRNSKSILDAQEVFESKQETMFLALDKLFALQNAILVESRLFKAFLVYSLSIFIIYMFTSTKQTYAVRPRLYLALCFTFLVEFAMMRLIMNDMEQQARISSMVRKLFVFVASAQLLHAIWTFRDFECLNHQMLLTLIDKVNGMQRYKELPWHDDEDDDIDWFSWVDTDLSEEVDAFEDPDYIPSHQFSAMVPRKHTLRYSKPSH